MASGDIPSGGNSSGSTLSGSASSGNPSYRDASPSADSDGGPVSGGVLSTAIFGGGCFWCTEAVFRQLRGVVDVVPGYSGGRRLNPTYEQVCSGATGHIEVVQVRFDPSLIRYEDLLRVFFATHDPTSWDRQGADAGSQYRSVIFWTEPGQRDAAQAAIDVLQQAGAYASPIVTQVLPAVPFWPAEPVHHDYFARNPAQGYCQFVVAPKVGKTRQGFAHLLRQQP